MKEAGFYSYTIHYMIFFISQHLKWFRYFAWTLYTCFLHSCIDKHYYFILFEAPTGSVHTRWETKTCSGNSTELVHLGKYIFRCFT